MKQIDVDSHGDLIVIGGGAAGFFCAINAALMNPSLNVTLLEKTGKLLSKVKASGGGRCNLTHACFDIPQMLNCYPRGANFLKKAFHQFFTTDTIKWFNEKGVSLKTEADGRMFPSTDSSQTIIDCLLRHARTNRVQIITNTEVKKMTKESNGFLLQCSSAGNMTADFVCVACGGYNKSSTFEWLKETGHSIEEPVPSLFTFNIPGHPITGLMGITVPHVQVKISGSKLTESGTILITHWGLSGPAVLRLSAWGARELAELNYQFTVLINWLPAFNESSLQEQFQSYRVDFSSSKIKNTNTLQLPQRLWHFLCQLSGVTENLRWGELPSKVQNHLVRNLCKFELSVKGKTTFKEEFVTAGGIKLNEIDASRMESKIVPKLFFAGEVINVDGITGGFNFQHAWTSGWIAAKAISSTAASYSQHE